MTEMPTGMKQPGAKGHQKPLEIVRGKKQILPRSLQKGPALLMP